MIFRQLTKSCRFLIGSHISDLFLHIFKLCSDRAVQHIIAADNYHSADNCGVGLFHKVDSLIVLLRELLDEPLPCAVLQRNSGGNSNFRNACVLIIALFQLSSYLAQISTSVFLSEHAEKIQSRGGYPSLKNRLYKLGLFIGGH